MDNYIVSIFYFAKKFLAIDGGVLLFHSDDPHILKEIRSYFEATNSGFARSRSLLILSH
jgi:hypothetical protein